MPLNLADSLNPALPSDLPADLLDGWQEAPDDASRAKALLEIVYHVESSSRWRAADLAASALAYASRSGDQPLTVSCALLLAFELSEGGRAAEAFRVVMEALALARTLLPENNVPYLRAVSTRATLRAGAGDEAGALRDYRAILDTESSGTDPITLLVARVNLAALLVGTERYAAALHQGELALGHLAAAKNPVSPELTPLSDEKHDYFLEAILSVQAWANLYRAEQMQQKGYLGGVQEALLTALEATARIPTLLAPGALVYQMQVEALLARIRCLQGDLGAALHHAQRSVELTRQMGQSIYHQGLEAHALVQEALGNWEAAEESWNGALGMVGSGRRREQIKMLQRLSALHEQRGQLHISLDLTRQALTHSQAMLEEVAELREIESLLDGPSLPEEPMSWNDRVRLAEAQAEQDPLTGLLNRRGLHNGLARLDQWAQKAGLEQLVALLDVDHFKAVNDHYSHKVGDQTLRQMAHLLADHVPQGALLARYGGEEFALVVNLPASGPHPARAATELLERLRVAVQNHDWSPLTPGRRLTLSVGAALRGQRPYQDALAEADQRLYLAKHEGRNQVRLGAVEAVEDGPQQESILAT